MKIKCIKTMGIALATVGLGAAAHAAPIEVVTDGGFESGTSASFTSDFTEGGVGTTSTFLVSSNLLGVTPNTGGWFMIVNGAITAPSTVWSQTVSVIAGTTYTLSFSMADWSGTLPDANLSIRFDGSEIMEVTSAAAEDVWEPFSTTWVAPSTATAALAFVELSEGFNGNDYALDDISLSYESTSAVPVPAALPLLAGGLIGLGALARRRPRG